MRFKKTEPRILGIDLTPMIDVTFQLIAFFMFIMNFSQIEKAEEIKLPTSEIALPPEEIPAYQIVLNLNEDVSVVHDGQRIERIDLLTSLLRRETGAAARQGVPNPGDISVVIRADQNAPTGDVQKLIAKCQDADLEKFSLRVKERK